MSKASKAVTPDLLVTVFNNQAGYPSIESIQERLGITPVELANLLEGLSKKNQAKLINRSRSEVPISESKHKVKNATREECIENLREMALAFPDKVLSRNFFRVNGNLAESAWNQHFGTFLEFKREANITLTRNQHKLEREIAKHASADHYRQFNAERADYADKYLKPTGRRYQTIMVASDLHDIEMDKFWARVWFDTIKRVQPDIICYNGDIFDLPEFSRFNVDPREWDVAGRIKAVHANILAPTRQAAPDAQVDLTEGNHEARMLKHLADATPAMRVVLSDLHGFTVAKLLGLDKFQVNYTARLDLAAWNKKDIEKTELAKNYNIYFDCFLTHHFPYAMNMHTPGVNGHHHRHQVWPFHNPTFGSYEWHQLGCGHKKAASYCEGEFWHLGFDIVNIDRQKKLVQHDYVPVSDFAVSGGKWYTRTAGEPAV